MKKISLFFSLVLSALLFSCGDSSEFRVAGVVDGIGTQNIKMIYYANGAVRESRTSVIDGKFSVIGVSAEPTLVELQTLDGALLGCLMVKNGETIECKLDKTNRYKVSFEGNDVSEQWGKFLVENEEILSSGDADKKNEFIAKYVSSHRDEMFSTVLMLTEFHYPDYEVMGDSLLKAISEEARPRSMVESYMSMLAHVTSPKATEEVTPMKIYCKADSLKTYNPASSSYSLLAFTGGDEQARKEILPYLKKWSKEHKSRKLKIVDISLVADTMAWHNIIRNDSSQWEQGWVLGSVRAPAIERLAIPRTPYFIVVDSAGTQLYRSSSIEKVANEINLRLNK